MTENKSWSERRQFGRRPLNADAVAELPGRIEVPCVIENLSEGGALLSFPTGVAPIEHFDLIVPDVTFRTPCEMRYQVGVRFGVRFKRQEHGEALIRHFFKAAAAPATPNNTPSKGPDRPETPRSSIRQLRETLLPLISPETGGAKEVSVAPRSPA